MGNKLSTRFDRKKQSVSQDADKTSPLGSQGDQLLYSDFDEDAFRIPNHFLTPAGFGEAGLDWQQEDPRNKRRAVILQPMPEAEGEAEAEEEGATAGHGNVRPEIESLEYSAFLAQSARASSPRRAGKNEDVSRPPQATLRRAISRSGRSKLMLDVRVSLPRGSLGSRAGENAQGGRT